MNVFQSRFKWLFLLWIWSLPVVCARAELTLIQRESFQGVGTLNASSPGNLGAVSSGSSFYKRAVGPRLVSDNTGTTRGWSADARNQFDLTFTNSNPAAFSPSPVTTPFLFDFWVYLEEPVADGSHIKTLVNIPANRTLVRLYLDVDGRTLNYFSGGDQIGAAPTLNSYVLPLRTWVNLRVAWAYRAGTYFEYDASVLARLAGSSTWSEIATLPDRKTYGAASSVISGFPGDNGGQYGPRARYGMPALYQLDAWADRFAPLSDVVDPPAGPFAWYCNPATGNDDNDGATPATAWATTNKLNAESANLGMFGHEGGYVTGDTLTIDTTSANLVLGQSSLTINTRALNVVQLGGGRTGAGEIQAWESVSGAGWTVLSGAANVYQRTLSSSDPSCVLWENDSWLNHPTGANLAAVRSALVNTPGSFWTDGATMYAHPFGNTNPSTDGKAYTRSFHRGAPYGAAAVTITAPDTHLDGLHIRKTCLADKSTNDPVAAYCIQTLGGAGGTALLENCVCAFGSKHIYGFTDTDLSRHYTVNDCVAEQGSPYVSAGGQTAWVDYTQAAPAGTATTVYNRCTTTKNSGLIGSAAGTVTSDQPAWLSHNGGSSNYQFSVITFNDCRLAGGLGTYGAAAQVNFNGGSCASAGLNNTNGFFSRVAFSAGVPTSASSNGSIIARNCIMTVTRINGGGEAPAQGIVDIQNCTFDLRHALSNTDNLALYSRIGTLTMTWRDNVVLGSSSLKFGVLRNAGSADVLLFDHNAYQDVPFPWFNYSAGPSPADLTLTQCQAIGQESGSLKLADVRVDGSLCPLPDSPLIDLGVDTGPGTDYGGAAFTVRNDPGAWEYPLPVVRAQPQATELTEGTALNLAVQVAGNGPMSFHWFRDGAAIPGAVGTALHLENVQPGQSGQYQVRISNGAGSVWSATAAVLIHPLGLPQWQAARFTAEELSVPEISGWTAASPDGSGLSNLEEYIYGVLPQGSATALPGVVPAAGFSTDPTDGSRHLTMNYRRLLNAVGVTCAVSVSDDLLSWDDSQSQLETVGDPLPNQDGRTETVTVRLKLANAALAGTGKFMRVLVTAAGSPGMIGPARASLLHARDLPTKSGPSNRPSR